MKKVLTGLLFISVWPISSFAEPVVVSQIDRQFSPTEVTAKVGDTLRFRNDDPYFHNVFSLSDTQYFDLGSFPQGEHRDIVLESPGVIEVECAIHPNMMMKITVTE